MTHERDRERQEQRTAAEAPQEGSSTPAGDDFEINFHRRAAPANTESAVPQEVILEDGLLQTVWEHANRSEVEVAGILLGTMDESGCRLRAAIPAVSSRGSTVRVTITHRDWDYFHREIRQYYPGLKIMGWYHSHPGHGIFLSQEDLFLHNSFFRGSEQVALVVDPDRGEFGLFARRGEQVLPLKTVRIEGPNRERWERLMFPQTGDCSLTAENLARSLKDHAMQIYRSVQQPDSYETALRVSKVRLELCPGSRGEVTDPQAFIREQLQALLAARGQICARTLEMAFYSSSSPAGEPYQTITCAGEHVWVQVDKELLKQLLPRGGKG